MIRGHLSYTRVSTTLTDTTRRLLIEKADERLQVVACAVRELVQQQRLTVLARGELFLSRGCVGESGMQAVIQFVQLLDEGGDDRPRRQTPPAPSPCLVP